MEKIDISHPDFAELSSNILDSGNELRFVAHGSSMAPFIYDGDILTIEPKARKVFSKGMIIFYRTQGEALMAHRIINSQTVNGRLMIRTRGDCSPGSEEVISEDQLLGLVVLAQRGERLIPINSGIWKTLGYLWAHLHPMPYLTYRLIRKIRSSQGRSEHS